MGCRDLCLDIEDLTAGSVSSDHESLFSLKELMEGREDAGVLSLRKQHPSAASFLSFQSTQQSPHAGSQFLRHTHRTPQCCWLKLSGKLLGLGGEFQLNIS